MDRCLLLLCLLPLIYPGNSLKCHSCKGTDTDCKSTEVTCPGSNDKCGTSTMTINSFPCKSHIIFKGCVKNSTKSSNLSISPSKIVRFAVNEETCDMDLCNEKTITDSQSSPNDLYCHSCISPGKACASDHMKAMRCTGNQKHCLSVKVIGTFGQIADVNFKGCAEIASCSKKSIFSSMTSLVSVKCCDGNFCNSETVDGDGDTDKSPNGVECYSCNTLDGRKCSPKEITKCYGPLTKCLEVAGMRMEDGKLKPTVVKGCSTPDMCEIPFIPLLQQLGSKRVECCNGNLCNNKFTEDNLQASGYFSGTGIQHYCHNQALTGGAANGIKRPPYYAKPVNTGEASNKYAPTDTIASTYNTNSNGIEGFGVLNHPSVITTIKNGQHNDFNYDSWNGNSNGGGPNPTSLSYDKLSGSISGSLNNPSLSSEIVQGTEDNAENFTTSESNMVNGLDSYLAGDNSNHGTILQGPVNDTWDLNSNGGPTLTSPSSNEFNGTSFGSISNPKPPSSDVLSSSNTSLTVSDKSSLQNSAYNNNIYSDGDATYSNVSSLAPDSSLVEDDNSSSLTPQGPIVVSGSQNIPQVSSGGFVVVEVDPNAQTISGTVYDESSVQNSVSNTNLYSDGDSTSSDSYFAPDSSLVEDNNSSSTAPQRPVVVSDSQNIPQDSSGGFIVDEVDQNTETISETIYDVSSLQNSFSNNNNLYSDGDHTSSDSYFASDGYLAEDDNSSSTTPQEATMVNSSQNIPQVSTGGFIVDEVDQNTETISETIYDESSLQNSVSNNNNLYSDGDHTSSNSYFASDGYLAEDDNSSSTTPQRATVVSGSQNITESGDFVVNEVDQNTQAISEIVYDESSLQNSAYNSNLYSDVDATAIDNYFASDSYFGDDGSYGTYGEDDNTSSMTLQGSTEISGYQNIPQDSSGGFLVNEVDQNKEYSTNLNNTGPSTGSNTITTGSALEDSKNNSRNSSNVYNSSIISPETQGSNIVQSSAYSTNVFNMSSAPPGDMNGYGSSSPSTGNHAGENKNNTSTGSNQGNNTSSTSYIAAGGGMLPTNGWSNNNGSNLNMTNSEGNSYANNNGSSSYSFNSETQNSQHTHGNGSTIGVVGNGSISYHSNHVSSGSGNSSGLIYGSPYNHTTHSGGSSIYNSGEMTPEGYDHGYNSAYDTYGEGGNGNGDHFMAPGGSSIEESYNNPNNLDSPHGNNLGYVSNNIFPGPNGTHGNYSNLILMLSKGTGISPALLSQRLNDSTIANPNTLLSELSNFSSFDPRKLSPELKAYLFGNSSQPINTYSNYTGFNLNKLPSDWNISNLSNTSNFVHLLANITGISPEILSQKLNISNMGNHSNLAKELSTIPGFNLDNLPPEVKKCISGTSGSPNLTYSDHGASSVGDFAYNSEHITPGDYNHGDSFGHDDSYGTYGESGHNNDNNHIAAGSSSNEPSHPNTNHLGSSYGNNYVYGSNIPLPGLNGTHGNYSNLILMLSKGTGINPALLAQRLNDSTMANPNTLLSELSNFSSFDPRRLSPELKAYLFGNNSQPIHTYPNYTGINLNKLPSGWNISNLSNTSNFVNLLANITGISSEILSQKLNKSNMGNHSNLAKELSTIPGFNLDNLPPEVKKYISGTSGSPNLTYSDHGASSVGDFAYNSDQIPPGDYNHGDSFSHGGSYGTYGEGEHNNDNNHITPEGSSNEPSHTNTNHLGSSNGNNYVYGSNIPLPGTNRTQGNYSNLILMLSKDTGISPALLSQKLNDSTMGNPDTLLRMLSNFSSFDPRKLSPELKAYLFGNSSQPIHTYSNYTGINFNKLHPGWNISDFSNTSNLVNLLANITGISPEILSQRLNKSIMGNHSNLVKELFSIPGFNLNNLPLAMKAYILGSNSNLGNTYPNHGTSDVSGFEYNSDHMSPDGHENSFGHDSSYDTYGEGEHSNSDHYKVPGGDNNETSYTKTKHPGSSHGNNSDLVNTFDGKPLLPGRGTNDSTAENSNDGGSGSDQNSASSLRSKHDVLAIVFTMTLLLLI